MFVFNFAIPVMIARTLALVELPERIEWALVLAYFGTAFLVFAIGAVIARRAFARPLDAQGIFGISACFSNGFVMGTPIILGSFGEPAAVPFFLLLAFHSATLFTLTSIVVEAGRSHGVAWRALPWSVIRGLVANPILGGIAVGLVLNHFSVWPGGPVDAVARMLADAALPCALFALGANLARFRLTASLREALALALVKTIVHPALTFVAATWVFGLSPISVRVAVTLAALPAGINSYLFAARYDVAVAEASAAIVLSTLIAAVTLSVLLVTLSPG